MVEKFHPALEPTQEEPHQASSTSEWDGRYHDAYENQAEKISMLYQRLYAHVYNLAYGIILKQGRDPLASDDAKVLMCGSANSETTTAFAQFVKKNNSSADLTVIDLNSLPLINSQKKTRSNPDLANDGLHFAQADALSLPFQNDSFDLIETDLFLQFFDSEARRKVIAEWARVISDTGVVMTREFLPKSKLMRALNRARIQRVKKQYGVNPYEIDETLLAKEFEDAGFNVLTDDIYIGPVKSTIKNIVAIKALGAESVLAKRPE